MCLATFCVIRWHRAVKELWHWAVVWLGAAHLLIVRHYFYLDGDFLDFPWNDRSVLIPFMRQATELGFVLSEPPVEVSDDLLVILETHKISLQALASLGIVLHLLIAEPIHFADTHTSGAQREQQYTNRDALPEDQFYRFVHLNFLLTLLFLL
jgi:hypothetical protein